MCPLSLIFSLQTFQHLTKKIPNVSPNWLSVVTPPSWQSVPLNKQEEWQQHTAKPCGQPIVFLCFLLKVTGDEKSLNSVFFSLVTDKTFYDWHKLYSDQKNQKNALIVLTMLTSSIPPAHCGVTQTKMSFLHLHSPRWVGLQGNVSHFEADLKKRSTLKLFPSEANVASCSMTPSAGIFLTPGRTVRMQGDTQAQVCL